MGLLPTGTVTFLFSDVVGSTRRWEREPGAMAKAMARHDDLMAGLIRARSGLLVKSTGDGVMAVFGAATDAVRTAVEAQVAVGSQDWSVEDGFSMRMGIHTGVADERDGDFFGTEVNRAARLMSAGHGGQILMSAVSAALVIDDFADLVDLGEHRLKDLSRTERIWQARVPGGLDQFPPLRTVDSVRGNLPVPTTSFVGRRDELDELEHLTETVRLLALVGVGGAGKTRLALELAARVSDRFEGGVWVVDLWQIDDPARIEDAIIGTLGLQYGQNRTTREILVDALGFSPVVIVLDTCEHIIDAVSDLAEFLIGRCPQLTLVATSREVLSSPSSVARSVDSLGVDAVELFEARAQATRGGFELTDDVRPSVERICVQLDGIPLAIELVAARTATLDPATLEARLGDVFRVVRGSGRGRVERHRTLEATIAWSHDLLDPAEQSLFDRLSTFLGGFNLQAAEKVCCDDLVVLEHDVIDVLERLVDKSMVTTIDDSRLGRRFRVLDTTRAFGLARLAATGGTSEWRNRHADYYAEWVSEVSRTAFGPQAGPVRRSVVAEIPNLRLAAEWATANEDLDTALRLAPIGNLLAAGDRFDAAEWLVPIVGLPGADEQPGFVDAVVGVAAQLFGAGELEPCVVLVERGMAVREDPALMGYLGPIYRALAFRTTPPDEAMIGLSWTMALRAFELSEKPLHQLMMIAPILFFLANPVDGDLDEFRRYWTEFERLVARQESEAMRVIAANAAGALAEVDPEAARPILEEAFDKSIELGMPGMTSRMRGYLARIDTTAGRPGQAARRLLDAIEDDAATGSWFMAWGWMHRLVPVLASAGLHDEAVILHHAIPPGRALVWVGDEPDEILTQARTELGPDEFAKLVAAGHRLDLDRANLIPWLRATVARLD